MGEGAYELLGPAKDAGHCGAPLAEQLVDGRASVLWALRLELPQPL